MNGTKIGAGVISAEVKLEPDWCHCCGVRQRAFAYVYSWENAEHALLRPGDKHLTVFRRYCGSCVKAMSVELGKALS